MKNKTVKDLKDAPRHNRAERRVLDIPIRGVDKKGRTIEVYSSTNDWDRYGERFEADAFKDGLEDYKKNPVFLWGHDYSKPPIGKEVGHSFDSKGLIQTFEFAKTQMANDTLDLYEGGFLNAVSVGFVPVEVAFEERVKGTGEMGAVFVKANLLETSAVPIPANPGALLTNGLYAPAMRLFTPKSAEEVEAWVKENINPEEKIPSKIDAKKIEEVLAYFKAIGKTLKGGKVSGDAEKSALIQVNNVIRTLVYGDDAPELEVEEVTEEQTKAIEKEAAFLMDHLKDDADLKELEDILNLVVSED